MWQSEHLESGLLSLADGTVEVKNFCIVTKPLTDAQTAKLQAHSAWKWIEENKETEEPKTEEPKTEEPKTEEPKKRKRGRPRKEG